jgi:hypothetical protein
MDTDAKQELLAAVNMLITSPDAHQLLDATEAVSRIAGAHPVKLTGDAAPMNALVRLRIEDPDAWDRVLNLIEQRRLEMGFDPLRTKADGYDKVAYMRQFMEQKRERQKVAVEIENLIRGERDALRGNARLEFMRRQSQRWKEQRDAYLDRAKVQLKTTTLTREQMQAALAQFWEVVDADLDQRLKQAKVDALKPGTHVRPEVQLDVLLSTLKFDPYKK